MKDEEIDRLLAPLLLRPLRPAERRHIADVFDRLATLQRQLADADQQIGHKVRRAALDSAPRKGGRPKGTGARFIRIEPRETGHGAHVHVGRALWQELGEPKRVDMQRVGGVLRLTPCGDGDGYRLTQPPNGMPKATVGQDTVEALRLEDGRHPAEISAGSIVTLLAALDDTRE